MDAGDTGASLIVDDGTLDLSEFAPGAETVFGGKACGLARLLAAGARVPAGFALVARTASPEAWPEALRDAFMARTATLLAAGPVAVRSSAVGEDSATRSFAGVLDSVLDVTSAEEALAAVGRCVAAGSSERARASPSSRHS